jgi:hypothetical protein
VRVTVDVINADDALRTARHDGLNAWIVYRRGPGGGNPTIALEGFRERIETWLTKNGYAEGDYHVIFE